MEPSFEPREHKGSAGPIVSIVIILLLMIAGVVYFWNERGARNGSTLPYIPAGSTSTTTTR